MEETINQLVEIIEKQNESINRLNERCNEQAGAIESLMDNIASHTEAAIYCLTPGVSNHLAKNDYSISRSYSENKKNLDSLKNNEEEMERD